MFCSYRLSRFFNILNNEIDKTFAAWLSFALWIRHTDVTIPQTFDYFNPSWYQTLYKRIKNEYKFWLLLRSTENITRWINSKSRVHAQVYSSVGTSVRCLNISASKVGDLNRRDLLFKHLWNKNMYRSPYVIYNSFVLHVYTV